MRGAAKGMMVLLAGLGGTLLGCQNKVHDENVRLWQENREKQARLDEQRQMITDLQERTTASPSGATAAAPTTQPSEVAQAPIPQSPIEQPAASQASVPNERIGGFETTADPIKKTVTVTVPGDVLFDPGQATIRPEVKSSLDKIVAALRQKYPGNKIQVHGHTDADPIRRSKWKSNQELSEARAAAVRNYLVSKGVEPNAIATVGHGASTPRSQSKAANRRVEITVMTASAAE